MLLLFLLVLVGEQSHALRWTLIGFRLVVVVGSAAVVVVIVQVVVVVVVRRVVVEGQGVRYLLAWRGELLLLLLGLIRVEGL